MIILEQSLPVCKAHTTHDPIHLFLQFYIGNDETHYHEIQFALQQNVKNPYVDSIILLNERIYTDTELGVTSSKIKQIVIDKRITYYDFLNYNIDGYKVLVNSDIFVDDTIQNICNSDIHLHKKIFALLRYEYNNGNPILFCRKGKTTGREDSQDTWIIHSNHLFSKKELDIFKIQLGIPGCDNKVTYLFKILGYDIYNDPEYIKTYHCHTSITRKYSGLIKNPYCIVFPVNTYHTKEFLTILHKYSFSSNNRLCSILENHPVLIPYTVGIENNIALGMPELSNLQFTSTYSVQQYKKWYLYAFDKSTVIISCEPWDDDYKNISKSQNEIQQNYKKPIIGKNVFEIFHYIKPWTHKLTNKRILILSFYIDKIQQQPTFLFPGCSFVYLAVPECKEDWYTEFLELCKQINELEFDVALCNAGGYSNPICSFIYSLNKTAIHVGDMLPFYFGLYTNTLLKERKEVMKLYMTPEWKCIKK